MNKVSLYDTIISPVITEKSSNMSTQNKVVFKVRDDANKKTLKKNIEKIQNPLEKLNKINGYTFWHDSDINSYKLTNNSLVAV